jgi:hypothetical protein
LVRLEYSAGTIKPKSVYVGHCANPCGYAAYSNAQWIGWPPDRGNSEVIAMRT